MQEVFILTSVQANEIRKALKPLNFRYWKCTIEINPIDKLSYRMDIKPISKVALDESGHEFNTILGVVSDAKRGFEQP